MENLQLIIGNKNFSSSSLRPWLLLNEFGVPFEEINIPLFKHGSLEQVALYSPTLKLPVLLHNDIKVWDSLAICEYLSETFLESRALPFNARKKAVARSVCNELHADFHSFKDEWPMNCQINLQLSPSSALEKEIGRLDAIMYCCRKNFGSGGDYLLGEFSIADCMMAPFAVSLNAYGALLNKRSRCYLHALLDNPHLQWWMEQAQQEMPEPRKLSEIA